MPGDSRVTHWGLVKEAYDPAIRVFLFAWIESEFINFTQYAGFFFHTVAVFDIDVLRNLDIGMTYLIDDRRIVNVLLLH